MEKRPVKKARSVRKFLAFTGISLTLTAGLFFLAEGFAGTIFILKDAFFGPLLEARKHTQYDPELGWVHIPNLKIPDLYGPGRFLAINSQQFRNENDFTAEIPAGKVRIMCSGDSYTMGYGVANDRTWCHLLQSINPRIESINLGQGGYGVDQAYLWYLRNSTQFEHDILIFAFITDDFKRMQSDSFLGYGKPFLELQNGVLINTNNPVPERAYRIPRLNRMQRVLGQLNILKTVRRISSSGAPSPSKSHENDDRSREIATEIFRQLVQINRDKNRSLVLVHLPIPTDYTEKEAQPWQQYFRSEVKKQGWIWIDLIEEFRKYPPTEMRSLFRAGHYSEKGNAYFAEILYEKMASVPELAERLGAPASQRKTNSPKSARHD